MTEETNKTEENPPEKLLMDDPANFPFHAAYLVYSEIFDKTSSTEIKKEINGYIDALKQNQIDLETFYSNVSRYRKLESGPRGERFSFQTQRKKDWRMKEQRQERIRRHKK